MAINKKSKELLKGYEENRKSILLMIDELNKYVKQVQELLPKDMKDYRQHKYVFEQQIKTVTEFMKLIFDMRKEISKSYKDEILLRDKLTEGSDNSVDLSTIMSQLDRELQMTNTKIEDISKGVVNENTFKEISEET